MHPPRPINRIVVLTGAGVSRESGVRTFRDKDGIWATVRIEDVATPEAFTRDPEGVNAFYNERRRQLLDPSIKPNAAHDALARLDREWRGDFLLVTQNVDDLHERAQSKRLVHMHGELLCARCAHCETTVECREDLSANSKCGACGRSGGMRPDVVWFGEIPRKLDRIYDELGRCDLFVAVGTSGAVHPAAQFVAEASAAGAHTLILNLEPGDNSALFAEQQYGLATRLVPALVERILAATRAGGPSSEVISR